jgi:ribonucleotide reductase alpha subunit
MMQKTKRNALHELGYKIFLDRYAQKDMTRATLQVGDTVIVVVDSKTGQREIGTVTALNLPQVTVQLRDGETVQRDLEHVDKPLETMPEQMMDRVAAGIAEVEATPEKRQEWTEKFRWLLDDWKFVPGGRILTGAGTDQKLTYYNCYVIPSPRDSRQGIMTTLMQMTEIMSRGGGVGINISSLRPRHAYVKGVNGRSSGSVSWGALYSFVTGLIEQGGCFGPQERILTDKGLIPAAELAQRMEQGESFYAHTHKGLRKITTRFRNGIKPVFALTTERGYRLEITEDHKVAVLMDGQITTMPLKYLRAGDEILTLLGSGVQKEYVALQALDYERSVMSTTLNENVRLPELLDEDLAYLLGYMYADGYIHMGKKVTWQAPKAFKLATADAYPAIRERLMQIIARVFGVQAKLQDGDGACMTIAVHSRLIIEWLNSNGLLKPKADAVRVPEAIFRSPSAVMGSFVAGYFDADGSNRGRKAGYGIDSISLGMLRDLQQLLSINGIASRISVQDRSAQGWQDLYRLTVTGAPFKARLARFAPAEKLKAEDGSKRDMNHTYPTSAYTALGARSKYRQRIHDGVSARISFGQLSAIRERLAAANEQALVQQVDDLMRVMPDTIASIEALPAAETFDFEVDDVHLLSGAGIYTSNSRRGALMLILNDWHPDVFNFVNSKRQAGQITNANISVGISDTFMEAVKADGDWQLMFPDTSDPRYDAEWNGDIDAWRASGGKIVHYRTIKARELWHAIIESAWASAEPGMWFRERSNKMSNSWYFNPLISTNPCITGDTRIHTSKGLIRARDLFEDETQFEVVIDGRFGIERSTMPSTRVFMTGVKPVFRLTTVEGYSVRATADHRFMTPRGWVELQHLRPGDKLHILNRKGGFGPYGSLEEGRVLGWMVGDGTIKEDRAVLMFFGEEKRELAPLFVEYVNALVEPLTQNANRSYPVKAHTLEDRDEARIASTRLRLWLEQHGLTDDKLQVPETVFQGTEDMQRGFLQALFTADGSVQQTTSNATVIRLASSHLPLLEQVQVLLSNFGIASRIYKYRREAQFRMMPDGKGGRKEYFTQAQHELAISKTNILVFMQEIAFLLKRKNESFHERVKTYQNGPRKESFLAKIEAITPDGVEDVFDLTEEMTHSMVINSFVTHQCGEQSLGGYSVCNLGAINLAKFYDPEADDVAWDELIRATKYGVRFLDNVIDSTPYFFEENRIVQLGERRIGLGTMGVAELMIRCGIRYGSDESVAFIDKLYKTIALAAYEMSIELAAEKGPFTHCEPMKLLESGYMQQMPDYIREGVREKGLRNVTLLTQAPTGCVAPDTLISTEQGMLPIVAMGDPNGMQWQIMTRKVYSDTGLEQTSHFYVNGLQPVKTVTTQRGFSISATHNHRLRVIDSAGNYVWRRMDELQPGDRMVLKRGTLGAGEEVQLRPVEQGNRALSDLPKTLTPEFAELLGLYMGDGCTKKRGGLHIVISKHDADLLEHVQHRMQQVWGERSIGIEERQGCWVANLTGYYIPRFFEANGLAKPAGNRGEGAAGAFIPQAVLRGGQAVVAAFLRGLFEADGCITRGTITLATTSHTLARQVQVALLGLGIVATLRQLPEQENHKGERTMYELRILNRREAARFAEVVGFISARKQAKLAELGALSDRGDSIAHPVLLQEFYATSQGLPNAVRQRMIGLIGNGALTQHYVKEVVAEYPQLLDSRLAQLVNLDIFLDEVATVEDGLSYTYDISVPSNHTYIANGFVSHNTTGTMVNTSTGIEPFFSWVYYRKSRLGLHEEQVPIVREWYEQNPNADKLPHFFVTAMEMTPEEHVKVQAAFQKWVDSSISKTANVPNHYTVEQVGDLYMMMYDLGCKGGTIYRDGSRDEQVLMLKGDERAEKEKKALEEKLKAETAAPAATPHHVYPRPTKLSGTTVSFKTPFGTAYITMNSDDQGNPFEVFITVGKAGSDVQADAEGLGRLISLQLRATAPHNRREMLKLIVEQLQNIGGARPVGFGAQRVASLPDAVANALQSHYLNDDAPQQLGLPMVASLPISAPQPAQPSAPLTIERGGYSSGADICPECGTVSFVRAEGCRKCEACGYSEC